MIVAPHGFQGEFLNYFVTVGAKKCLWGAAMNRRFRIVVTDVATDPLFSDESKGVCEGEGALSPVHPVDRSGREIRWDRVHAPQAAGTPCARWVGMRRQPVRDFPRWDRSMTSTGENSETGSVSVNARHRTWLSRSGACSSDCQSAIRLPAWKLARTQAAREHG
jgi:hypothetical protein